MTENHFFNMPDEELRNMAIYFYVLSQEPVLEENFGLFERELVRRFNHLSEDEVFIEPRQAIVFYDILDIVQEKASSAVLESAANAEENIMAALEKAVVSDYGLKQDDLKRNEIDLNVYMQENPFEKNEDGSFAYPEFEKLADIISDIVLLEDDETPETQESSSMQIINVLKATAQADLYNALMHSREKIDERTYFELLYDQMVWNLMGMFLSDSSLSMKEAQQTVSKILQKSGWNIGSSSF